MSKYEIPVGISTECDVTRDTPDVPESNSTKFSVETFVIEFAATPSTGPFVGVAVGHPASAEQNPTHSGLSAAVSPRE
jgi:hypothetical protein